MVYAAFSVVFLGCSSDRTGFDDAARSVREAVVDGRDDDGDPAVVLLFADGQPVCTASIIAPHLVLTAAHCIDTRTPERVEIGSLVGGASLDVVAAFINPEFDPTTVRGDAALLVLGSSAPVDPLPTCGAGTAYPIGTDVRVVGFGLAFTGDGSPLRKREGDMTLAAQRDGILQLAPNPSSLCHGDSGGPALVVVDGVSCVAGVTSSAANACAGNVVESDVRALAGWISQVGSKLVERHANLGERCYFDEQCAELGADCYAPPAAPDIKYCTHGCALQSDCPDSLKCVDGTCRYDVSPGEFGTPCVDDADCESGLCSSGQAGGLRSCALLCFPGQPTPAQCGNEDTCVQAADRTSVYACFQESSPSSMQPGGCRASPRPAPDGYPVCLFISACCAAIFRRRSSIRLPWGGHRWCRAPESRRDVP
jgi:hypothetical protein